MNKAILKKMYLLLKEIENVEKKVFNTEFLEGHGFVYFEKMREEFWNLYHEFEEKTNYPLLDYVIQIEREGFKTFEFSKLSQEELQSLTDSKGNVSILKKDQENFPHAIISFKDIDEVIDYVLR